MKSFTLDEVAKIADTSGCYIVVSNNKVYDVTHFIKSHPGGTYALLKNGGRDQTKAYNFHTTKGKRVWEQYHIGYINKKNNCCVIS